MDNMNNALCLIIHTISFNLSVHMFFFTFRIIFHLIDPNMSCDS